MIFVKNVDGLRFERVNQATEKIWGYKRDELIGKSDYDFFLKDEADFYTKNDSEVLNKKILLDIPEETIHTKFMGEKILHTKKIPLLSDEGLPNYLLGISEDVTDRKKAEQELIESEQRLKLAQESANIGLWDWIIAEDKIIWSKELGKMYNIDQGTKMAYEDWINRVHPDDAEKNAKRTF
jgi:PAS domain S-box-containing protein